MEPDLTLAEKRLEGRSERPYIKVLRATLEFPVSTEVKISKLVLDMMFFKEATKREDCRLPWYNIWCVIGILASHIPWDHPWHHCLVQAVGTLLTAKVPSVSTFDQSPSSWENEFGTADIVYRRDWDIPCEDYEGEEITQEDKQYMFEMKNYNFFLARIASIECFWLQYAFWSCRVALDHPMVKGPAMDYRVSVACEWLINIAEHVWEYFFVVEPSDSDVRAYGESSPERWDAWKTRLSEIATAIGSLEMNPAIKEEISHALKKMEEAEEKLLPQISELRIEQAAWLKNRG